MDLIASIFGRRKALPASGMPLVYLDFSSGSQPTAVVALRIRNKSDRAVTVSRLEFVHRESDEPIDVSECMIGGARSLRLPVKPGAPGALDIRSAAVRSKLKEYGLSGSVVGAFTATLAKSDADPLRSPSITVDLDNGGISYRHVGQGGAR